MRIPKDKVLHFSVNCALALAGVVSYWLAVGLCVGASIGKEVGDKLLMGDLDMDTPISDAHKMEAKMPNAALVVLEGTDHYSFLYKPVEFRNILRAFLGIGGAA